MRPTAMPRRRWAPREESAMAKAAAPKKPRVYEVAKDLGMSSEAVLQIVRRLGVDVKNHMSTLPAETVEKVRAELNQEKTAVREAEARKHEHELQRAREERARQHAAASATATPSTPTQPAPSAARAAAGTTPRSVTHPHGIPKRRHR